MIPDQLAELIRSAVEECKFDGEDTYGLRILAQNASCEFWAAYGKAFDRDQWIRDCGFKG